jgi:hypothetical protein
MEYMSTETTPPKQELAKEIWRTATSLSDEMQNAAIRKARELGFDLSKGRISLEETLINLTRIRDLLIDAGEKNKLVQLPLKVQAALYSQTQKVVESLSALVNGTDAIMGLEDSVEDLTGTVWQYNLPNLSDQVLGYQNKMNRLKSQEVLINQVFREAEDLRVSGGRVAELLRQIEDVRRGAEEQANSIQASTDKATAILSRVTEQEQKVAAVQVQVQQYDSAAAQYLATAKTASADLEAMVARGRSQQMELESSRVQFGDLAGRATQLLSSSEKTLADAIAAVESRHDQVKIDAETKVNTLRETLTSSIQELVSTTHSKNDAALAELQARGTELATSVTRLMTEITDRVAQTETTHESRLNEQLRNFSQRAEGSVDEMKTKSETNLTEVGAKGNAVIEKSESELKRLVGELDSLEGRIRESIERATGYTLFHSFQKRQMDLAASKRSWAIALACAVGISVLASGFFIWSLQYVQVYNAAFYLKLSISLPLIYAIAFCSVQYGRERRLEEEYAFKSSISISLEPYQKLVGTLVDRQKPEELSKYTAFIIESVNRVFTSPTDRIFDDHPQDRNAAEKVIKAVGDLIEPLAKAIKR